MKLRREPLLIDKFLALNPSELRSDRLLPREYYDSTRANLRLAKLFVLSREATTYCAQLLKEAPRIIADAQDFAIPPFRQMYLEIPFDTWYETLTGEPNDRSGDRRMGYLIVGSQVRVLVEGADGVELSPVEYHLNEPLSLEQEVEFVKRAGTSRIALDLFYWGGSAAAFGTVRAGTGAAGVVAYDEWQKEGLRALRANHGFAIHLHRSKLGQIQKIWESFSTASAGDLRNIIGLLLFLNRTSQMRYEREEPFQQRMLGRRPVNLLKHRTITLHVNPVPQLLSLAAGEGIRRRLHDVKGHFCHNQAARVNTHTHDWVEAPETALQWHCACGGVRWWRKAHKRGSEDKGIVTSSYNVVP